MKEEFDRLGMMIEDNYAKAIRSERKVKEKDDQI